MTSSRFDRRIVFPELEHFVNSPWPQISSMIECNQSIDRYKQVPPIIGKKCKARSCCCCCYIKTESELKELKNEAAIMQQHSRGIGSTAEAAQAAAAEAATV